MNEWLVGVDEAGRGSLVGEMIITVAAVPRSVLDELVEAGVRDSKELTPARRRELYWYLAERIVFAVQPVRPWEIDRENLTILTEEGIYKAFSTIVRRLGGTDEIARVTVDKYGRHVKLRILLRKAGYKGPVIIEERADARYVEVAAASIIAKHVRDSRLRVLSSLYGVEGSGYPSDERTVAWVLRTLEAGLKPPIIRYSWGTLEGTGHRVRKKARIRGPTLDDFM